MSVTFWTIASRSSVEATTAPTSASFSVFAVCSWAAASRRERSLISRATLEAPTMVPLSSRIGDTVSEIDSRRPPLSCRVVSKWSIFSPARILASTISSSFWSSVGISIRIDRPTASAAVYPNMRSAAAFHDVMTPFRSFVTIASSDDSTTAARRRIADASAARALASRAIFEAPMTAPASS